MWVFAVFGCLAAAALVASQVVRRHEARRRHEEAQLLVRRPRPLTDEDRLPTDPAGDVPVQREVSEKRHKSRSRRS